MDRRKTLITAMLLATITACAGKDGAAGPTGPQGAQGPQGVAGLPGPAGANGSANRLTVTGVAGSSGTVGVSLGAAVGMDPSRPPQMACYLANLPQNGTWLAVAGPPPTNTSSPWCGLTFNSGGFIAAMFNVPAGWTAAFVVSY